LALVVLLLLNVSQAGAQPPVPHDVVFLIDNSPSVQTGDTTGDGIPDGPPTDEQDVRLRLARFVVNVLGLDPASADQRVGAISFARSEPPLTLMPLTPVRDWSKADFAEIAEVDQGSGTDFAAALRAASEMLFPPGAPACRADIRRCDVVMITDGLFDDVRRDPQAVGAVLRNLRGVAVHVLTFGAGHQDVWQGFVGDTLISTYQPDVTLIPPDQVYGAVLRELGAEALLADLTPVEVAGQRAITVTVPPFRTWTRYQVLPDSPLTVTFLHTDQVVTPVVAGTEYTFFQPPAGEWVIQLQGNGLAYYRQVGEGLADLALYLRMPEGTLALGDDVPVQAGIVAGGALVTDTRYFTVTATISGPGPVISPLVLAHDLDTGLLVATVPSDRFAAGTYAITLVAGSSVPGVQIQPVVARPFEVIAPPTLAMTVMPSGPLALWQAVHITVRVGNWQPGYVPELTLYKPDGTQLSWPKLIDRGDGLFTAEITSTQRQAEALVMVARLSVAGTSERLQVRSIYNSGRLPAVRVSSLWLSYLWPFLVGLLVGGLVTVSPRIASQVKTIRSSRRIVQIMDQIEKQKQLSDKAINELSREFQRVREKDSSISKQEMQRLQEFAKRHVAFKVARLIVDHKDMSPMDAARWAAGLVSLVPVKDQWFWGGVAGIILKQIIADHPNNVPEIMEALKHQGMPEFFIDWALGSS
jgi:hypothetical protein